MGRCCPGDAMGQPRQRHRSIMGKGRWASCKVVVGCLSVCPWGDGYLSMGRHRESVALCRLGVDMWHLCRFARGFRASIDLCVGPDLHCHISPGINLLHHIHH